MQPQPSSSNLLEMAAKKRPRAQSTTYAKKEDGSQYQNNKNSEWF